jgi:LmbE family N-acetylglucosaminyl deacetylase
MAGWPANSDPGVFSNVDLAMAAARLGELMDRYHPQVVVTYDSNGGYGHPDHIQAHKVALAASAATGVPSKIYFAAIPRSGAQQLRAWMESSGTMPEGFDFPPDFGTPDEEITTVIDVSAYTARKLGALAAHASQTENFFLTQLPPDILSMAISREAFILSGSAPSGVTEDDLFAGLR